MSGNSHQRAMEKAAAERIAKQVSEAIVKEILPESKEIIPQNRKKVLLKLLEFLEHPWVLWAMGHGRYFIATSLLFSNIRHGNIRGNMQMVPIKLGLKP